MAQVAQAGPTVTEISVQTSSQVYRTRAWVAPIGRMRIYGLDPDDGSSGKAGAAFAYDIAELGRANPRSTVSNGGFSAGHPSQPAGLLVVAGHVVSPLSRSMYPNGRYRLSAILCQSQQQGISLLRTADIAASRQSLLSRCASAIQAGPMVVENGLNGIGAAELKARAYVRTMVGQDASGRAYLVVFTRPIHLYAAAEFLRAPRGRSGGQAAVITPTPSGLTASQGLGLSNVMNLDGDTSTAVVHRGQIVVGDPSLPRPSAVVFE